MSDCRVLQLKYPQNKLIIRQVAYFLLQIVYYVNNSLLPGKGRDIRALLY